ncbi:DUF6058 family natural product biosynthesis protein [Paremcibacter congregatus]|uniref:Uncharacterized protein n=1 Tax=Paremcibacter congregatus TaxID=2043170 RepID=A0A2G4YNI2_9PROT|nr:DUF6058 family natural product biosynthesis protein [Paremcibacter congregatus]PHZ83853.1 hypothetical protein CRD36_16000 [Paremcibacter congregatus]QDE27558.1 hypothetical protein FIV45_09835 [Paremcibacter congregatus]
MSLLAYLEKNFFTRQEMLQKTGLTAGEFDHLQKAQLIPRPSYVTETSVSCSSFFGPFSESQIIEYYARDSVSWVKLANKLATGPVAFRLFKQRYQAKISRLNDLGYLSDHPKVTSGLDQHIVEEWQHFLDGIYGLCTTTGLPEEIAAKELAITIIKAFLEKEPLTEDDRRQLKNAVDLLDDVSAPFAPHEIAKSSRQRLINDVHETYALA